MESIFSLREEYSPVVVRKPKTEEVKIESPAPKRRKIINLRTPSLTTLLVLAPITVFATGGADTTFISIYKAIMNILDHVAAVSFIFAGATWMMGHRTQALERVICAAIGYLIAIHAVDLRDFLKGL